MPTLGVCVGSSFIAGVSAHDVALSGIVPVVLFMGLGGFLLLVIPLGAWILAAREAGSRPPSSWAARTDNWFFWAAGSLPLVQAANTVGLVSLFIGERRLAWCFLASAAATQLLWGFGYLQQRRRLGALRLRAEVLPPCAIELAAPGSVEDLGIGGCARGQIVDHGTYRAAPRLGACIVGDFAQAEALLRHRAVEYGRLFATACVLPLAIPSAFALAAVVARLLV